MSLIKWDPFANDLERVFEDFPFTPFSKMSLDLSVDLYEQDGNLVTKMYVPDIEPKNVAISIADRTLHIAGSREEEKEVVDEYYYRKEIRSGSFSRAIRLPKPVDGAAVDATYKDGVLKITMPIVAEKEESLIHIKVE